MGKKVPIEDVYIVGKKLINWSLARMILWIQDFATSALYIEGGRSWGWLNSLLRALLQSGTKRVVPKLT